jgi:hypothetical protein
VKNAGEGGNARNSQVVGHWLPVLLDEGQNSFNKGRNHLHLASSAIAEAITKVMQKKKKNVMQSEMVQSRELGFV